LIAHGSGRVHRSIFSSAQKEQDMHNMMAAPSVNAGEDTTMDPIEQAARASEKATGEFAQGSPNQGGAKEQVRATDAAAAASDQAVRAGVELMQRNAETIQRAFQCGARLAARFTELSADQFGRAFGLSGESAEEAAQKSSHNVEAIVQSGAVLTEITQRMCEEWAHIARARVDRGFERFDAFMQCRTPHDFTALSSELLRDNMETFLGYARKAGEHSVRLAAEMRQPFGNVAGSRKAA
jgi:Phasin protein